MSKEAVFAVLTRVGFVARGLLYIAIAVLVIFLGKAASAEGALAFIGDGIGQWMLVVIAIGFAAYGLWRLADAAFGTEHPGDGNKALVKRAGAGASGLVHLFLAYTTADIANGTSAESGGADRQAQMVLELPGGQLLLAAVAVGLAIAAVVQFARASKCSFLSDLVPEARRSAVKWLGRVGYFARGVVFLVAAYFLMTAAIDHESWKAGGTEQLFTWLSRPLSLGVAAGLFLFGLYGLVEAWYRNIHTPDIDGLAAEARSHVT